MTTTTPIAGPLPTDASWHDFRLSGIFASEAAAACGLSPYRQPLDVYLAKLGLAEPFEGNEYTARGKRFEPFIAQEYEHRTGNAIDYGLPCFRHPTLHWMGATPDGVLRYNPRHGVEFKACNFRRAAQLGDEGTDEIFEDWLCQVQHQMAVMDWEQCDVFVMVDLHTYKVFPVERNDKMIARMVELEGALWDRIVRGDAPDPDFSHPGALDLVKSMHGVADTTVSFGSLSPFAFAYKDWHDARNAVAEWTRKRDAAAAKLLHEMGIARTATCCCDYELVRTAVEPTLWTDADIEEAQDKLGTVKRKGYVKLTERKIKHEGNTQ